MIFINFTVKKPNFLLTMQIWIVLTILIAAWSLTFPREQNSTPTWSCKLSLKYHKLWSSYQYSVCQTRSSLPFIVVLHVSHIHSSDRIVHNSFLSKESFQIIGIGHLLLFSSQIQTEISYLSISSTCLILFMWLKTPDIDGVPTFWNLEMFVLVPELLNKYRSFSPAFRYWISRSAQNQCASINTWRHCNFQASFLHSNDLACSTTKTNN